jgi:hypothetical protein
LEAYFKEHPWTQRAVVVVEAADDVEAARVQEFLLRAGATKQAFIPREGDLD